ncbi:MAG: hypothetical protein AB8H12_03410 [Lewinella sp.]
MKLTFILMITLLLIGGVSYYLLTPEFGWGRNDNRVQVLIAKEKAEQSFNGLGDIVKEVQESLSEAENYVVNQFNKSSSRGKKTSKVALKVSDEIDATVCRKHAAKIGKLKRKFNNIESAVSFYFTELDTMMIDVEEAKNLHKELSLEINNLKRDYANARNEANDAIQEVEQRYLDICHYKELIIIMTTIEGVRQKIDELKVLSGEAKTISNEIKSFSINGKNIIHKEIGN